MWALFMHIHAQEMRNTQETLNGRYQLEDVGSEMW
jgi:hypothetical protein